MVHADTEQTETVIGHPSACTVCKAEGFSTSYMDCEEKRRMDRDGLCFKCAFWSLKTERKHPTIINGIFYGPGNRTSGEFRGMGGRRFDIEYFDGRRITTFDLWCGGEIPDVWRDKLPDTAKFLGGAHDAKVGETLCFDGSRGDTPPYPLPRDNPPAAATG